MTVACVAFQDAPYPDLEPRLRGIEESATSRSTKWMNWHLHFAAYYGWAKAIPPQRRDRTTEGTCARGVADETSGPQ